MTSAVNKFHKKDKIIYNNFLFVVLICKTHKPNRPNCLNAIIRRFVAKQLLTGRKKNSDCIVRNVNIFLCRCRQSLILQIALNWIEQEKKETEAAKAAYMAEHCPSPDLSGDQSALMVRAAARSQRETQSHGREEDKHPIIRIRIVKFHRHKPLQRNPTSGCASLFIHSLAFAVSQPFGAGGRSECYKTRNMMPKAILVNSPFLVCCVE